MKTEEIVTGEELLYHGKIFDVKKYTVELPDGTSAFREEVEHHGGACVLAVYKGNVCFVRQYRLSLKRETLEIPAGKLEKGEDPLSAAMRELTEETGLVAENMEKLFSVCPSTGYVNECIHIYYATGLKEGTQRLDTGEFLNVVYIPVEECFSLVESGKIADAKTLIALLWLKDHLSNSDDKTE
ncbi:MAG: NUDIX hydrolase [Clostridia bacterium]|nr:NUDIX hydrolase [Clostridia bacterium]